MPLLSTKKNLLGNERGAVFITGLLIVLVLTVLGTAAMMSTATELKIASNDRSSKQVFYLAEAGLEDARSRMQLGASASPISDNHPTNSSWTAFVGSLSKSVWKGYQSENSNHSRFSQLDPSLNYVVTITHKTDASGNILYWGDSNTDGRYEENTTTGRNIYVITSEGYTTDGAAKPVRIEATRVPPVTAPAALYTKANTTIQGTSTYVLGADPYGSDPCGGSGVPGIITRATVNQNGNPHITGNNPSAIVENSDKDIDIQGMIDGFKGAANYSYNASGQTLTGMNWGIPAPGATLQDPTSCSEHNIVHFNTNGTFVRIRGGSAGCGILLVEGDLVVEGGFQWYGVILATGTITFTGGGGKNVTGGILAGGSVSADLVGGDANIVYCGQAIDNQTNHRPLLVLRWVEMFS